MKVKWTDLNLSHLKNFVDAVITQSLTKAAILNNVSRPAISQSILKLESKLNADLLIHKKKNFALTPFGQDFFLRAQEALKLLEASLGGATRLPESLSLGCSATIAEHIVLPFLKTYRHLEASSLQIRIGTSAKVRKLVEEGEANLGLLIDDHQTAGFYTNTIKEGSFELQSKSGKLAFPIMTTENRPEVTALLQFLEPGIRHIQIESWGVARKTAEAIGGTCLVPDLIPLNGFKRVDFKKFKFPYKVLAITKNQNTLSKIERVFFEGI